MTVMMTHVCSLLLVCVVLVQSVVDVVGTSRCDTIAAVARISGRHAVSGTVHERRSCIHFATRIWCTFEWSATRVHNVPMQQQATSSTQHSMQRSAVPVALPACVCSTHMKHACDAMRPASMRWISCDDDDTLHATTI